MTTRCFPIVCVLLLVIETLVNGAEGWSVDGGITVIRRIATVQNSASTTNTYRITGFVSGGSYLVTILPILTEDEREECIAWDGTSLHSVQYWSTDPRAHLPMTNAVGHVEHQPVPRFASRHAQALAMALAEELPLRRTLTNDLYNRLQLQLAPFPEQDSVLSASYNPVTGMRYITSWSTNYVIIEGDGGQEDRKVYWPAVYTNGFLHWSFNTLAVDPVSKLPALFEWGSFVPKVPNGNSDDPQSAGPDDTYRTRLVRGELSYKFFATNDFVFTPPLNVLGVPVWDSRYRTNITPNQTVPSTAGMLLRTQRSLRWTVDAETSQRYVAAIHKMPLFRKFSMRPKDLAISAIVVGIFLVLPFLLWKRKTSNEGHSSR